MFKYASRYLPLLILALLLIPVRLYFTQGNPLHQVPGQPSTTTLPSPFKVGSALYGLAFSTTQQGWAVGGTFTTTPDKYDKTLAQVVGASGTIMQYTNGNWRVVASARKPLLGVAMVSASDVWVVGYAGELLHYDGQQWANASSPTSASLRGVAMLAANNGWAVGFGGTILHYDGSQWSRVASPTTSDLQSLAMPSTDEGWAVGANGTILHYHAGAWSLFSDPLNNTLTSVSMLSPNEGWAVGNRGTILHYRDGAWGHVGSPTADPGYNALDFYAVAMTSGRSGWLSGSNNLMTYSDEIWTDASQAETFQYNAPIYSITMTAPGEGWAAGDQNTLYHCHNGQWSQVTNG